MGESACEYGMQRFLDQKSLVHVSRHLDHFEIFGNRYKYGACESHGGVLLAKNNLTRVGSSSDSIVYGDGATTYAQWHCDNPHENIWRISYMLCIFDIL